MFSKRARKTQTKSLSQNKRRETVKGCHDMSTCPARHSGWVSRETLRAMSLPFVFPQFLTQSSIFIIGLTLLLSFSYEMFKTQTEIDAIITSHTPITASTVISSIFPPSPSCLYCNEEAHTLSQFVYKHS